MITCNLQKLQAVDVNISYGNFSTFILFSDLNQLTDISLSEKYSTICGISQDELQTSFSPYIDSIANRFQLTHEQCYDELKQMYDGYHFCGEGEGIYNPYSLLHAFDENKFGAYWFESGTPTFLIAKLKTSKVDVRLFLNEIKISEVQLKDYRPENPDPTPLFYQSGYLTIKSYNLRQNSYKLGFPNNEVKYGFLESLAPSYLNVEIIDTTTEQNFQNVIFMALTLLGKYVHTEVHSAKGRADCILETDDYVYIFEFKRDIPASQALEQIKSQGYATPYAADKRKLFKIGVNFSSAERNITEWVVEQ